MMMSQRLGSRCVWLLAALALLGSLSAAGRAAAQGEPQGDAQGGPQALAADCSVTPMTPEQRAVFWGTAEDPPAEVLMGVRQELYGTHFYVSDEKHPELFIPHIENNSGAYIGIGSDQAYLYIGWAKPQVAWVIDYDPHIVAMHLIQHAFFKEADTFEDFLKLWRTSQKENALALIDKHYNEHPDKKLIKDVLEKGQARIPVRMRHLRELFSAVGIKSYMNDEATYKFVRDMVRNGCIRPMLGDLLAENGLRGIGEAAHKLGVPVRVLYLSNAEEYWKYNDGYRGNIRSLPFDDKSVVLRTQGSGVNHDYRYNVQPALKYMEWLDAGWAKSTYMIVEKVTVKDENHFPLTVFTLGAEEGKAAYEERRAKEKKKPKKPKAEEE
jgi:hypothetical protein